MNIVKPFLYYSISDLERKLYLIWKGSYNDLYALQLSSAIIAYLIWKGSYNSENTEQNKQQIIAYLIWKGSYNGFV